MSNVKKLQVCNPLKCKDPRNFLSWGPNPTLQSWFSTIKTPKLEHKDLNKKQTKKTPIYKNWGFKNILWKEKSTESYSGYIKDYSTGHQLTKILMLPFCTKNWSSLTSPASNISPGNFLYLWIKVKKEMLLSDHPITSLDLQQTPGTTSWKAVGTSCLALTSLKLNEAK